MTWDPYDHLDVAERADWEVRQHLWAKRRLAELEEGRPSGRRLLVEEATSTTCHRRGCHHEGRLIRLTGDTVCAQHDPLAAPYWGGHCCHRREG